MRCAAHRLDRGARREQGSGTVLVLGGMSVLIAVLVAGLGLVAAVLASHRARAAADLAALAAAASIQDVAQTHAPCPLAASVAGRNHARVTSCVVVGDDVTVVVQVDPHWRAIGPATARAKAGPD